MLWECFGNKNCSLKQDAIIKTDQNFDFMKIE